MSTFNEPHSVSEPQENMNTHHGVVHFYNKNETYHLTFTALRDVSNFEAEDNFFQQLLTNNIDAFNQDSNYGSFAYLCQKSATERNLFLNVNTKALNFIVNYVQTSILDTMDLVYSQMQFTIPASNYLDEIINLATILNMPQLLEKLRDVSERCAYLKN